MGSVFQDICARVDAAMARHLAGEADGPVLAAVSGGPDSVVLLRALWALGRRVEVAHFDHGTRGGASGEDAAFVRALAGGLGLPCHVTRRDVPGEAAAAGQAFEQHARALRYTFFEETARARGCVAIATGHHADDQAETVLMRVLRGTGPAGLAGIPPVRRDLGVPVVRPMLAITRADIMACIAETGWVCRHDATNADTAVPRNQLRHEILPLLARTCNPGVREALCRLAETQRELNDFVVPLEEDALARCVSGPGRLDRAAFAALHPALRHRCLLRLMQAFGVAGGHARVVTGAAFVVEAPTGKCLDLGGGLMAHSARDHVLLRLETAHTPPDEETELAASGVVETLGRRFTSRLLPEAPADPRAYCNPARQVFDADRVSGVLRLRTRRPGDRFTPLGMSGTRKLQDYCVDRGLPRPLRGRLPLLVDDAGIVWVVGHAIDARAAVGPGTRRVLEVTVSPRTEGDVHAPE